MCLEDDDDISDNDEVRDHSHARSVIIRVMAIMILVTGLIVYCALMNKPGKDRNETQSVERVSQGR